MAATGQSLHQEGALCSPPPQGQSGRVRKGRGRNASMLGGSRSTNPAHPVFFGKYTDAGIQAPPAPQGLCAPPPRLLLPGPPPTKKAEAGWAGGGSAGEVGARVSSLESVGRQHKAQIFFPGTVSMSGGQGAPSQPAQASYFLPVRWMCWKRVMEKAMPRI